MGPVRHLARFGSARRCAACGGSIRALLGALSLALSCASAATSAHAAELTVSAAASLTTAFKDLGQAYERAFPGARVHLNFGASGALLQQIAKGAPVDVFAPADEQSMAQAEQQQLIAPASARVFAGNALVVVTPRGAHPVAALRDLAGPAIKRIAIGQPASVPAGRYARHVLERTGQWQALEPKLVYTQNVRQALDYVARGEADAGFIYATDAAIMKNKLGKPLAVPLDQPINYPIAVVRASGQQKESARFVGYVLSPAGQAILARHGFSKR